MEDDICCWCGDILDGENSYRIEQDGWYHHNDDWVIEGGTCWEQRVVVDFPELSEWLEYGFTCDGCVPSEEGECTCVVRY